MAVLLSRPPGGGWRSLNLMPDTGRFITQPVVECGGFWRRVLAPPCGETRSIEVGTAIPTGAKRRSTVSVPEIKTDRPGSSGVSAKGRPDASATGTTEKPESTANRAQVSSGGRPKAPALAIADAVPIQTGNAHCCLESGRPFVASIDCHRSQRTRPSHSPQPTSQPASYFGTKPANAAFRYPLVVPVLPATGTIASSIRTAPFALRPSPTGRHCAKCRPPSARAWIDLRSRNRIRPIQHPIIPIPNFGNQLRAVTGRLNRARVGLTQESSMFGHPSNLHTRWPLLPD